MFYKKEPSFEEKFGGQPSFGKFGASFEKENHDYKQWVYSGSPTDMNSHSRFDLLCNRNLTMQETKALKDPSNNQTDIRIPYFKYK